MIKLKTGTQCLGLNAAALHSPYYATVAQLAFSEDAEPRLTLWDHHLIESTDGYYIHDPISYGPVDVPWQPTQQWAAAVFLGKWSKYGEIFPSRQAAIDWAKGQYPDVTLASEPEPDFHTRCRPERQLCYEIIDGDVV